jgi:hypothetical protein
VDYSHFNLSDYVSELKEIDINELEFLEELGTGQFGVSLYELFGDRLRFLRSRCYTLESDLGDEKRMIFKNGCY